MSRGENPYRVDLPGGTKMERSYRVVDGERVPRGNWQWVVYDPDRRPSRKRTNLRTTNRGAAMVKALEKAKRYDLGTLDPWTETAEANASGSLADAIKAFVAHKANTASPATVATDRAHLERLSLQLPGGSQLRHVEPAHVEAVVNGRRRKGSKDRGGEVSAGTKARRRASLLRFFAWCVERGMLAANPAADVKTPARSPSRRDHITEAEADAILRTASAADVLAGRARGWVIDWVVFGLGTGLRPSEQRKLKWSAVRLSERAIEIGKGHRVKTSRSRRRVPVTGAALAVLQRLAAARTTEADGLVFRGAKGGAVSKDYITRRLKTLATRAGVAKNVTAYSLRHAYGTRMAAAGVPLLDLARLMGTSVRMIEEHYGHYDPERGASHVERVFGGGAWSPPPAASGDAAQAGSTASVRQGAADPRATSRFVPERIGPEGMN